MLSEEQIERFRLEIMPGLIRESTPWLRAGTPEQVDRKFEPIRRENDIRTQRMLEAFARSERVT